MSKTKYIFVIGGVLSGVGKGVTTASIGRIFKNYGKRVSAIKIDPYINVDAGTMNPVEHGEVYVTEDGDETDQDMGNYERFLGADLFSSNYMTTGRVYQSVIEKERSMYYKGKCVQVVPHIPFEVIDRIKKAVKHTNAEMMVVEVGGTVGEYENILFLEAARMMKLDNPDDVAIVLVGYMPVPSHLGEMKTKPTQHAARTLNNAGLQADFIIARGKYALDKPRKEKLALFCWMKPENIVSAPDVKNIYEIPGVLEKQNFGQLLAKRLKIKLDAKQRSNEWDVFLRKMETIKKTVKIAVVGKYFATGDFTLADSYISVIQAVKHAAWANGVQPEMTWIDSENYEKDPQRVEELKNFDALIVPGGFGTRGIEGIIKAIQCAREKKIPYLGLCYGMQLACIEFARNVLGYADAHTVEVNKNSKHLVINVNPYQQENINQNRYGGTMRLGSYACDLKKGSRAHQAYGQLKIGERHRHRYEFDNKYRSELEKNGFDIVGVNPETNLVEIVELKDHPYFIGVQFHPEFKSRPLAPHPLFVGLMEAALKQ
ncbi:MAG: CTP synthase [Candidatus Magasanikbacteria bacterium]|nr:CTP synthase [Candidatus Magasanikbacteria bacterium]